MNENRTREELLQGDETSDLNLGNYAHLSDHGVVRGSHLLRIQQPRNRRQTCFRELISKGKLRRVSYPESVRV